MNTIRCLAALAAILLVGCATNGTTTVAQTNDPARRTYSQDRLRSTGENNVGDALAKTDPSVSIARGR